MIDALLSRKREDFVSAVRALDRALLSGFYVVPLFYVEDQWLAHDSELRKPEKCRSWAPISTPGGDDRTDLEGYSASLIVEFHSSGR